MLILVGHATTPDKLKLITSNVCDIDVYSSYIDCSDASPPVPDAPNKQATNITTATTTDILAGVANAAKRRNVKNVSIRNVSASITTDVTVVVDAIDGSDYELHKATLAPGERLGYDEGIGWFETGAPVIPEFYIRAAADRTLPNDTNLNAIFNSPANGRLTLPTGVYVFDGLLIVTAMSATSGNALINIIGAGTATVANWMWQLHGLDNSTPATIADDDAAFFQTGASAASAVSAGTGTAMRLKFDGTFEVTAAGTLIPSIDLVTAAAAVLESGSHFRCRRIGDIGFVSEGPWD